jgi:hypothetical protein
MLSVYLPHKCFLSTWKRIILNVFNIDDRPRKWNTYKNVRQKYFFRKIFCLIVSAWPCIHPSKSCFIPIQIIKFLFVLNSISMTKSVSYKMYLNYSPLCDGFINLLYNQKIITSDRKISGILFFVATSCYLLQTFRYYENEALMIIERTLTKLFICLKSIKVVFNGGYLHYPLVKNQGIAQSLILWSLRINQRG